MYYAPSYLKHHGIKGMKWGRRRYQNKDGSLTPAGKKRYVSTFEAHRNATKAAEKARKESIISDREQISGVGSFAKVNRNAMAAKRKAYRESIAADKTHNRQLREENKQAKKTEKENRTPEEIAARRKKALKVGAAVAGTALAAYGAYKLNQYVKTENCKIAADRGWRVAEKNWQKRVNAFYDDAMSNPGKYKYGDFVSNSGQNALNYAEGARQDSFRKAAKNVMEYRKYKGKTKYLRDLDYYKYNRRGSAMRIDFK